MDNLEIREQNLRILNLYLLDKKEISFKGKTAIVVGTKYGKVLLLQDGKRIATDPINIGLYLFNNLDKDSDECNGKRIGRDY